MNKTIKEKWYTNKVFVGLYHENCYGDKNLVEGD